MKKSIVFGFYGESDTGKTSLIEKTTKRLTGDGYKIATVKITDREIGVDTKGKDTWKHAQAGSKLVVLSSPIETDYLIKESKSISEIIQHISILGRYDLILVEGANDKNIPKIRLGDIPERENTILEYHGDFEGLINLIKDKII